MRTIYSRHIWGCVVCAVALSHCSLINRKKAAAALIDDPIAPYEVNASVSDVSAVLAAKGALTDESILASNTSLENIRTPLTLPKTGDFGVSIAWSTESSSVVDTSTGAITRPGLGESDASVTLVASLTKGEVQEKKIFSLVVKAAQIDSLSFQVVPQTNDYTTLASNYISDVYVDSAGKTYAATNLGLSVSSDGTSWRTMTTADGLPGNNIKRIEGSSSALVALAGPNSNGFSIPAISKDGGTTWKYPVTGYPSTYAYSIAVDGTAIYVGTVYGIYKTTDYGVSWSHLSTTNLGGGSSSSVYDLYVSGSTLYAGTGAGLSLSSDGGSTWSATRTTGDGLGSNTINRIFVDSSNSKIYVATTGGLSVSSDSAATFSNITTSAGLPNNSVSQIVASGSTVLAVSSNLVSVSTNGGTAFSTKSSTDGLGSTTALACRLYNSKFYVGTYDGISSSTDALTYSNVTATSGLFGYLYSAVRNGDTIYVSAASGIFKSTDGGKNFSLLTSSTGTGKLYLVGSRLYIASTSLGIYYTDDFETFTNVTTANGLGSNAVYALAFDGTNTIYAATGGGLSISSDGAQNFTNKTTSDGLPANLVRAVTFASSKVYVGTASGLGISSDGGASFTTKTYANSGMLNNDVRAIVVNGGNIYLGHYWDSNNDGGLSISSDGGTSFVVRTGLNGIPSANSGSVVDLQVSDGAIFLSTWGGFVISLDGGLSFRSFDERQGLPGRGYGANAQISVSGKDILYVSYYGLAKSKYNDE